MAESAPADNGQGTPPIGTPPALPATTSVPAIPWLEGADEVTVGYIQNKGWDGPGKLLDSYRNLEKVLGADRAGNTVVLPKDGAPPEEMSAFYSKIGRPADPAGYKFQVPEGGDAEFSKLAQTKMHELGIPQKMGEGLAAWWNEYASSTTTKSLEQKTQAFQADDLALKQSWGQAFTQNLAQAQAFARGMGLEAATIDKMADSMGHKATMEFFQKLGAKMGEADFVSGNGTQQFGQALTPGQAQAKIADLKGDKEWMAKYLSGGTSSAQFKEMQQLMQFGYPENSNG